MKIVCKHCKRIIATDKQQRRFDDIKAFWIKNKSSPTHKDLSKIWGVTTDAVAHMIEKLLEVGLIERNKYHARSIFPIGMKITFDDIILEHADFSDDIID